MSTASGIDFRTLCRLEGLAEPVAEYRFAAALGRAWRFDWAWPTSRLALEVDGGVWQIGRHQRPAGFRLDRDKMNAAVVLGWRVLHCEPADMTSAALFSLLRAALAADGRN